MVIFQKESQTIGITDQMTVGGWEFDAQLVVSEKNGNAAAIHSGRILFLSLSCGDEIIAYFDGGTWYQSPMPEYFEEGVLALEMFIEKWSRPGSLEKWKKTNATF